jgi:transposase InsO family protein
VRIYPTQTAANAQRFLRDLERAVPMKIARVLTDNGKAVTDRLFGLRKRSPSGQHEFDLLCAELGIEHRLAPPMRPQSEPLSAIGPRTMASGMVERFNGRIEDILQSHRFHSGEDLEQTILRYVHLYNSQLPQSVLKGRTPIDALKDWHRLRPDIFRKRVYFRRRVYNFRKRVYNHTGCDINPAA